MEVNFNRAKAIRTLKAMHTVMKALNDERYLMAWFAEGVPSDMTDDDFNNMFNGMSDDDAEYDYETTASLFARIVRAAIKDGEERWTSMSYLA